MPGLSNFWATGGHMLHSSSPFLPHKLGKGERPGCVGCAALTSGAGQEAETGWGGDGMAAKGTVGGAEARQEPASLKLIPCSLHVNHWLHSPATGQKNLQANSSLKI